MKNKLFLFLISVVFLSQIGEAIAQNNLEPIKLKNDKLALRIHGGTGEIERIDYLQADATLLKTNGMTSPWEITVDQENGESKVLDIRAAKQFSSEQNGTHLTMLWEEFSGEAQELKVIVRVELLPDSALSSWRIRLEGVNNLLISKVRFPIVSGLAEQKAEEFAVPDWMGALLENPRQFLTPGSEGFAWEYPGHMSMQFMSISKPGAWGTYFASDDTLAYTKTFRLLKDKQGLLGYAIDHYPSYVKSNVVYEPPYAVLVGGFKGDWLNSAQLYKGWAKEQSWSKNSRLFNNQTPEWVNKTSYWVWNRGRASNVLDQAMELNSQLGGGVNVLWHWWHKGSYDDSFPEYFPPRDGDQQFISSVKEADKAGVRAIVYMNALKWGPSTASWKTEGVEPYTVKNIDGKMRSRVYNIFTKKALTYMCESTDFWKRKYASLVDTAINKYHLAGIYMDQTCLNSRCYDSSHGHDLGGGNYWMKEHAIKNSMIRETLPGGNKIALAAEGVGENWLPYNDMFLALQVSRERYAGVSKWRTIPLFQSVYHEYGITFGNYSSLLTPPYDEMWPKENAPEDAETPLNPEFNVQFIMEQARSFAWGMQPMIANYQPYLDSVRSTEIDYLKRLAKVRTMGLDYFLRGEYLRPPVMDIPEKKVVISKLSIYAGQNEKVTRLEDSYPLLYTSAWRSPSNRVAIAFASIDESSFPVKLDLRAKDYGLKEKGEIYLYTAAAKTKIGDYKNGIIRLDFTLSALGIGFVEFLPEK